MRQLAMEEARKAAFWEGKLAAQRNKQKCMDIVVGPPNGGLGFGAPTDPVRPPPGPPARPSSGPPKRPTPVMAEVRPGCCGGRGVDRSRPSQVAGRCRAGLLAVC